MDDDFKTDNMKVDRRVRPFNILLPQLLTLALENIITVTYEEIRYKTDRRS